MVVFVVSSKKVPRVSVRQSKKVPRVSVRQSPFSESITEGLVPGDLHCTQREGELVGLAWHSRHFEGHAVQERLEVVAPERKEPEGQVHPKSERRIPVEMHARHLGDAVERQRPAQTAGQSEMAVHAGPEVEKV